MKAQIIINYLNKLKEFIIAFFLSKSILWNLVNYSAIKNFKLSKPNLSEYENDILVDIEKNGFAVSDISFFDGCNLEKIKKYQESLKPTNSSVKSFLTMEEGEVKRKVKGTVGSVGGAAAGGLLGIIQGSIGTSFSVGIPLGIFIGIISLITGGGFAGFLSSLLTTTVVVGFFGGILGLFTGLIGGGVVGSSWGKEELKQSKNKVIDIDKAE